MNGHRLLVALQAALAIVATANLAVIRYDDVAVYILTAIAIAHIIDDIYYPQTPGVSTLSPTNQRALGSYYLRPLLQVYKRLPAQTRRRLLRTASTELADSQ